MYMYMESSFFYILYYKKLLSSVNISSGEVQFGLPSGAVTGIVIGTLFIVFFLIPFCYYLFKGYWVKRNQYGWYRRMSTPSTWGDCCSSPTPRRNFNLTTTTRSQPTAEVTLASISTEPTEPVSASYHNQVCIHAVLYQFVHATLGYGVFCMGESTCL